MPQSARQQDQNGFLLVKGCPISSFGIFQYSAAQVGLKEGDPNRIINVFRPEEAVSDPELLASLQEVPLINDHEMLSGFQGDDSATAPEDYGIDGVLFNVGYDSPWTRGDLKVFTRQMQADLNSGKKDLSLGYTCDFEMQSGVFDGVPFEVVQTNMRGNHIALVDSGRVPGAKVLDGKKLCFDHLDFSVVNPHGENMKRKGKALDSSVVAQLQAQLKALLPTFEQFLNEEATEPAHQEGAAGAEGAAAGEANAAAPAETGSAATGAEGGGMGSETGTGEVAAEPAPAPAAGGAEQPTAEGAAAGAEGEEDAGGEAGAAGAEAGGESAGGAAQLISQLEAILAQLKQATGAAAGDEGAEGGEEGEATNAGEEQANDTVEGLEATTRTGDEGEAGATGEQGRASPGPAAGKHAGLDAAVRAVHADIALKNRLHDGLSKVVGAFDGAMDLASATARDVAVYGVKKLKIKCTTGQEIVALDGYLNGLALARKATEQTRQTKRAADAAANEVPAIDAYFKE
jgi:hypothetical protein